MHPVSARLLMIAGKAALAMPTRAMNALWGRHLKVNRAGMTLDGKAQLIGALAKRFAIPPRPENLVRARAQFKTFKPFFDGVPIPLDRMEDVDLGEPGRPLPGRLYIPRGARGPLPVLVFYHGGGYCYGGLDDDAGPCPRLAAAGGFAVLSVDYRLAPESPFPAAVDDAVAAFRAVVSRGEALGLDPSRVAVGGDSAGGCLSAVVSVAMRDRGGPQPCFQLLIYPVTHSLATTRSREEFNDGFFLTGEDIDLFLNSYLPRSEDHLDPRASPLLTEDLRALPDALVLTAGFDPLRDEAKAYAERLRLAGVQVEYICYEDMIHGFISMGGALEQGVKALNTCARAVADAFAKARPGA